MRGKAATRRNAVQLRSVDRSSGVCKRFMFFMNLFNGTFMRLNGGLRESRIFVPSLGLTPAGPTSTSFKNAPGVFVPAGGPGHPPAPQRFLAAPTPSRHVPLSHVCHSAAEKPSAMISRQDSHGMAARGLRRVRKTGGNAGAHPGLTAWMAVRGTVETRMSSPARSAR